MPRASEAVVNRLALWLLLGAVAERPPEVEGRDDEGEEGSGSAAAKEEVSRGQVGERATHRDWTTPAAPGLLQPVPRWPRPCELHGQTRQT